MSASLRLFIALALPDEVKDLLEQQQRSLMRALPYKIVRWSNPKTLHLTLIFLGYLEPDKVELIKRSVAFACRQHRSFDLQTAPPGAFPSAARPSVLYTGVGGDTAALSALVVSLADQLYGIYEPDKRGFKPHLTLGRVKKADEQERIARALQAVPPFYPVSWRVETVSLYSSSLTPEGARYDALYTSTLGAY